MRKQLATIDTIIYQSRSGAFELKTDQEHETIWLTQEQMASLFDVQKAAISKHLKNIFDSDELTKKSAVSILETTAKDNKIHKIKQFNLDAAHLLYFVIKNHPFIDGNKRSGAYAFVWYLRQAKILDVTRITPPALTALTLLIAESSPKNKDKIIGLVCAVLKR